jgi:hypothetical protein
VRTGVGTVSAAICTIYKNVVVIQRLVVSMNGYSSLGMLAGRALDPDT